MYGVEFQLLNKNNPRGDALIKIQIKEESESIMLEMKCDSNFEFYKQSKNHIWFKVKSVCGISACYAYYDYAKTKVELNKLENELKKVKGGNYDTN